MGVVPFTNDSIRRVLGRSAMVQALLHEGIYRGQKVIVRKDGLVYRRHVG
ncbi:hypothetical protein F443_17923 [Phytophthora nicotianae P1569]|uniref:Uncharacterized protein n=1 Tax=Phytophthora nicotianae P1569 TaxID=1317065 RepID=V9EC01_PHYNI|nr:hypothetical protein F443_17923 [Phytophthora nicotianae P1569]